MFLVYAELHTESTIIYQSFIHLEFEQVRVSFAYVRPKLLLVTTEVRPMALR
jgi:hypothetical protein